VHCEAACCGLVRSNISLSFLREGASGVDFSASTELWEYVSVKGNSRLGQSGRVNEMSKMAIFGRRAIVWIEQTGAPWLMYTVQVCS
jgi:hypothetical protein